MGEPSHYYEKVYAGVLGKVIGVYVGKPFEGWTNADIESRLGEVWYYVHDRLNYPLVCADDDISGTFTFIRALPDHGRYREITSEQIGQTWLNYLIEHQTVLWWGGMGISTEHTAWLRLADGVPAPRSGSIELNGAVVAEQIGAQIFIDAFGLVAPGQPELAADLAARSARVSHDGEAVYGAQVVAAMVAAAFDQGDMNRLLDIGASVIPADSLIARIHRDVRQWAGEHGDDWRATLEKIQQRYGYDRYGGGCHVVPNHALMVMAWAHAPENFQKALMIVNTAGWDTDCNSANVGCVMGVQLGLAGLNAGPDWQGPFADRLIIPTAEGSRGLTDCLREADLIAAIGRKVMGWSAPPPPKDAARFHFCLPGARHGFLPVREVQAAGDVVVTNPDGRLRIDFAHAAPGQPARVATPTFLTPEQLARQRVGYAMAATPTIYSGQRIAAELAADQANAAAVNVRIYLRHYLRGPDGLAALNGYVASHHLALAPGQRASLSWTAPDTGGWPIAEIGLQIEPGDDAPSAAGTVWLDRLDWSGQPTVHFADAFPVSETIPPALLGWIIDGKLVHRRSWQLAATLNQDRGVGLMHTGASDWRDYRVSAQMAARLADRAGLVVRYLGLRRYLAVLWDRPAGQLQLVRQYDDRRDVLATAPCDWQLNESHRFEATVRGQRVEASADGVAVLATGFESLSCGGIAMLSESGTASFWDVRVEPA